MLSVRSLRVVFVTLLVCACAGPAGAEATLPWNQDPRFALLAGPDPVSAGRSAAPGWLDRRWFERLPLENRGIAVESRSSWGWTGLLAGTALAGRFLWEAPEDARWTGGILFDDEVRDGIVARSESGRETAGTVSDLLEAGLWTWLVLDTALTQGREAQSAMWRMNIDALMANLVMNNAAKSGFARERPDGSNLRSFYSGHAAGAATAAGLLCAHHLEGRLYGSIWRDRLACGGAAVAALGVGLLRLRADKHYASDVLVGWAAGVLWGYVLPTRWHYRPGRERFADSLHIASIADHRSVGFVATLRF